MKLPFTGRNTASSLQRAIAEHDTAVAKLAELHTKRAAALLDSDELDAVQAIDKQIEAEHRTISIQADRIIVLDTRVNDEAAEARARAYETAVDSIARLLPLREAAAAEVQSAILALASAVRKYVEISGSIVAKWPTNVSRPSYHLGTRRLGETLRNAFSHPALIFASTRQPLSATDLIQRACDAAERAEGFSAGEAQGHVELLTELRQRGVPAAPVLDEEGVAA
jgi:hypothetical protein